MPQKVVISIKPYLAHALAMTEPCHEKLNAYYNTDRARFYAAALKSEHKNAAVLRNGRTEHLVMGMRALGILEAEESEEDIAAIKRILRAANKRIYAAISKYAGEKSIPEDAIMKELPISDFSFSDSQVFNLVVIAFVTCSLLRLEIDGDKLKKMVSDLILAHPTSPRRREAANTEQIERAKRIMKKHGRLDANALYDRAAETDDKRDDLEEYFGSANTAGFDLGEYADGIYLSTNNLAVCLAEESPPDAPMSSMELQSALIFCTMRAIVKDRNFCLDLYREDKSVDYDLAVRERDKAQRELAAAEDRIAALRQEAAQTERKQAKLENELLELEADRQELATLRSALHDAGESENEEIAAPSTRRVIPAGSISIGGIDPWRRAMQEAVPEVTFYAADVTIARDVIRNAGEIWFQPAYIGHSQFETVIAIARAARVPVRYFSSTGVARSVSEMYQDTARKR